MRRAGPCRFFLLSSSLHHLLLPPFALFFSFYHLFEWPKTMETSLDNRIWLPYWTSFSRDWLPLTSSSFYFKEQKKEKNKRKISLYLRSLGFWCAAGIAALKGKRCRKKRWAGAWNNNKKKQKLYRHVKGTHLWTWIPSQERERAKTIQYHHSCTEIGGAYRKAKDILTPFGPIGPNPFGSSNNQFLDRARALFS